MLDKNNDGHITREELQGVFARGNKETSKLLDGIIAAADINKDGNLSLQEFKAAMKTLLSNKF
jgi:Ca2+-binding EF-hand superfamily protein